MIPTNLTQQDTDHDLAVLSRELDRVKSKVFLGRNAAFLGSLMSSLYFHWSYDIPTAGTDGDSYWWNPNDFMKCTPEERCATVEHELWHVARLHILRCGLRDPEKWNIACDIRINRDLRAEGHTLVAPMWVQEHREITDANGVQIEVEEDIYDWIVKNNPPPPPNGGGQHMIGAGTPGSNGSKQRAINNVVKAVQQAKIAGAGNLPGGIEQTLNTFLAPIIPWEVEFQRFFTDLLEDAYTWRRPNRRYGDMYLPSPFTEEGRLAHLAYYFDVSGSVTDNQVTRFNSEVKYVKDQYDPLLMSLMQFDTMIQSQWDITESDRFDELKVHGRGGTSLACVADHIDEHKPTAAIIFSDMFCSPMRPLQFDIPIIWVCIGNKSATVPFGKLIHIKG